MSFFAALAGPVLGIAGSLIEKDQANDAAKASRDSYLGGINNAQNTYGRAVGQTPTAKENEYNKQLTALNKSLTQTQKQADANVKKYQQQISALNPKNAAVKAKLRKDPNYIQNETARLNGLISQEQAKPVAIKTQVDQMQQNITQEKQNRDSLALKPLQDAYSQQQQALQTGLNQSTQALNQGTQNAQQNLLQGYNLFKDANAQGRNDVTMARDTANQALNQGYDRYQQANAQGRADIQTGMASGNDALQQGYNRVLEAIAPYQQQGNAALGQMGAISGANGYDQQQQAVDNIAKSPLFAALQNQSQEALLQKASATGGLRGGNTQAALATLAPQMLNQQINEQYNRLNPLATYGYNASNTAAQAGQNLGTGVSQNNMSGANQLANLATLLGGAGMQVGQGVSSNNMNTGNLFAQLAAQLGQAGQSYGTQLSALDTNTAAALSNLFSGYGTNVANMAGGYGSAASNLFTNFLNNTADLNMQAGGVGANYQQQKGQNNVMATGSIISNLQSAVNPFSGFMNSFGSAAGGGGAGGMAPAPTFGNIFSGVKGYG